MEHRPYEEINKITKEAKRVVVSIIICILVLMLTIFLCWYSNNLEKIIKDHNYELKNKVHSMLKSRGLHKNTVVKVSHDGRLIEFEWTDKKWYRL